MAKAASNTAPTIKIKVVTIAQFSSVGPYSSYRYERRSRAPTPHLHQRLDRQYADRNALQSLARRYDARRRNDASTDNTDGKFHKQE